MVLALLTSVAGGAASRLPRRPSSTIAKSPGPHFRSVQRNGGPILESLHEASSQVGSTFGALMLETPEVCLNSYTMYNILHASGESKYLRSIQDTQIQPLYCPISANRAYFKELTKTRLGTTLGLKSTMQKPHVAST